MKKWFFLFFFLCAFSFFLPRLLSTSFGKKWIVFYLEKKYDAQIDIETLSLSWLGPQKAEKITLVKEALSGEIATFETKRPLWSFSQLENSFFLEGGHLFLTKEKKDLLDQISVQFERPDFFASAKAPPRGKVEMEGKLFSKEQFDLGASFQSLATELFDAALHAQGYLLKALGDKLSGSFHFFSKPSLEKTIFVDLTSPNLHAECELALFKDHIALKTPALFDFKIKEEFSKALFKEKQAPVFSSKTRASLELLSKPSFFPFHTLKKLSTKGLLDLSQMYVKNVDFLQPLYFFLKKDPFSKETTSLWLTPFTFEIDQEMLWIDRVDFLIDGSIHLCLWGKIDLAKEKLHLYLGVPREILQKTFGLTNLPNPYVLKLPLKGTLKNPKLDTASALAKLGTLKGFESIPNRGVGKVLQLFTPSLQDEDVPQAHRPFPWE